MKFLPLLPDRKLLTGCECRYCEYMRLFEGCDLSLLCIYGIGGIPPRVPEATVAQIMRQAGYDW